MRQGIGSYWVDGKLNGNFSLKGRDSFDPDLNYMGVRIQQGVPVLDRDWNELEDIRRYQEIVMRRYLGDGPLDDDGDFKVTAKTGMTLSIAPGRFLVDGVEVKSDSIMDHTPSTPATTPKKIYVYLKATFCEVTSDGRGSTEVDSHLTNSDDANVETCIRHKVICTVESSEDVLESDPPYWRSLLATIDYTGGGSIQQNQITDSRASLKLLKKGDLDYPKIDGLEIGNGTFLVRNLDRTLQVAFLNTAGNALTSPYFYLSPVGALLTGPVRIGGDATTWPISTQDKMLYVAGGAKILDQGLVIDAGGLNVGADGATIAGVLTANDGLTVNNGATINGGLTLSGGTFEIGVGVIFTVGAGGEFTKGLTVTNDDSPALTVSKGATIEGGLTASGESSIKGLTVNNGADISGLLTTNDGLTVKNGATISGDSSTTGLTVSNGADISGLLTANDGLTVTDGATIGGLLTANDGLTVTSGELNITSGSLSMIVNSAGLKIEAGDLTIKNGSLTFDSGGALNTTNGADLVVNSEIQANEGVLLPVISGGSAPQKFKENDYTAGATTYLGGEFKWRAVNDAQGHRLNLYYTDYDGNESQHFWIASDGSYYDNPSDQNYKTNVATLTDVLQKIDQMRGVSFDWNDLYRASHYGAPETRQIGMIAQEVQAVYPELVLEIPQGEKKFLGLKYDKFTAILVQAVKELKAMNEALSDRVKALEAPAKNQSQKR